MEKNGELKPAFQNALSILTTRSSSKRIHIFPEITEKNQENAHSNIGVPAEHRIMVLLDESITSSSKRGICITDEAIYWRTSSEKGKLRLEDINQIEIKPGFFLEIKINGSGISVNYSSKEEIEPFVDFLQEITSPTSEPSPEGTRCTVEPALEVSDNIAVKELESQAVMTSDVKNVHQTFHAAN